MIMNEFRLLIKTSGTHSYRHSYACGISLVLGGIPGTKS
jgi:hypothetical protein